MIGLGKSSKLSRFLRRNGLSQQDLVKLSGVNSATVSRLCSGDAFKPSIKNAGKIIRALKKIDQSIEHHDFWSF